MIIWPPDYIIWPNNSSVFPSILFKLGYIIGTNYKLKQTG